MSRMIRYPGLFGCCAHWRLRASSHGEWLILICYLNCQAKVIAPLFTVVANLREVQPLHGSEQ